MTVRKFQGDLKIVNGFFMLTEYADKMIQEICKAHEGKYARMTFEVTSTRSAEANRFYWGTILDGYLREMPDYSKESLHRLLGKQFLRERLPEKEIEHLKKLFYNKSPDGVFLEEYCWYIKSTSNMSVHEFWVYCEKCILQLMEIGGMLTPTESEQYDILHKKHTEEKP